MASSKRGAVIVSTLMLIAIVISGCDLQYSTPPAVTNTPIGQNSLFGTAMEQPTSMSDIEMIGTSTALALTGTPLADIPTQTPGGPEDLAASVTPTPLFFDPALTSTATLAVNGAALPTSMPVGSRPASYTLQKGEFPYCIARRFDVDPAALLSLNGLSSGDVYYPNMTLKIPQSGNWPGTRALRTHPATYTVAGSNETVYSVACLFGDVDPGAIAQANNLSAGAALTTGQQLSIP